MNYFALPTSLSTALNTGDTIACTVTDAYTRLTSPKAIATYRALGRMTAQLTVAFAQLIYALCFWAYAKVKHWVDTVNLAQPIEPNPVAESEYFATVEELFAQADEIAARSMPQTMTAPVATLRLAPSHSHEDYLDREIELNDLTVKQLVPIAKALNLPTRKVKKALLISSILKAEGYKI